MKDKKQICKTIISVCIFFIIIPLVIWFGVWLFNDRKYNVISMAIALLSCVPFFIRFEKGKSGAREVVVIAVMTAFSVIGRLIFSPVPGFKPVTAITIIAGIALGAESGFMVGSLTAIVSNIFFGQGPWTPFQMFVWGIIGFLSGLIFYKKQTSNRFVLAIIGLVGGVAYSLLMDIWTTVSMEGTFNISRYLFYISSSFPFMAIYAVSNVVFLFVLAKPFLEKLNRIKTKYGIFQK